MSSVRITAVFYLLMMGSLAVWPAGSALGEAMGKTKRLQVIGTAEIHGGNVATARDDAIRYGLWNAVEQEAQHLLSPASVVSHFQSLNAHIFSQSEAFVQDYKVLTESKVGRRYRVIVEVTVLRGDLLSKLEYLGILATEKDLPRIILLLSEKNVGWAMPRFTWEQNRLGDPSLIVAEGLTRALKARGFTVLQPDRADGRFPATSPTDETALRWAKQLGADIAVLGNAVARPTGNVSGTGMQSVEARISLRAFRVETTEPIGSFEASNATVHNDERVAGTKALGSATSDITTELIRQVTASWSGEATHAMLVKLFVTGIERYADFVQLRKTLKDEITGTRNVYLRGIRTGEAQVDVEIQGTAQALAEELVLQNFEDFGINVVEVGQDMIRLDLTPKDKGNDKPGDRQEPIEMNPLAW